MTEPPETLPLLFIDDDFVAINKPSGLLVHRSMIDRHETRFALQMLRNQLDKHVYPLHRLDKPTSGILMFALSSKAARDFNIAAAIHHKEYLAVTRGYAPQAICVDHPLREEQDKICDKNATLNKPAQSARSEFERLDTVEIDAQIERYPTSRYSLIKCVPSTGRKHQLRRHLKHLSHPIIGDAKHGKGVHNRYFAKNFSAGRLLLHASKLTFKHPYTGKTINISAPLDTTMSDLFERFNWSISRPHNTLEDTPSETG